MSRAALTAVIVSPLPVTAAEVMAVSTCGAKHTSWAHAMIIGTSTECEPARAAILASGMVGASTAKDGEGDAAAVGAATGVVGSGAAVLASGAAAGAGVAGAAAGAGAAMGAAAAGASGGSSILTSQRFWRLFLGGGSCVAVCGPLAGGAGAGSGACAFWGWLACEQPAWELLVELL